MIKIGKNYVIEALPDCYAAKYLTGGKPKVDKKTGKEVEASDTLGYFGKLKNAVIACRDDAVKRLIDKEDFTMREAVTMITEVTDEFEKELAVLDGRKEEHI